MQERVGKPSRGQQHEDAPERVVTGNAVGQGQEGAQPGFLGFAKLRHVGKVLHAAQQCGDGDQQHVNEFVFAPARQPRIGQLEQLVFQGADSRVLHPQYQPYLNEFGNL